MDNNKTKKGKGRPEFKMTDANRKMIESLSGFGIPQEQIAALVGCSVETMVKYCGTEWLTGKAKANSQIVQTLYKKALSGDTTALIFWCKTQIESFQEKSKVEITGTAPNDINEAKSRLLSKIKRVVEEDTEE